MEKVIEKLPFKVKMEKQFLDNWLEALRSGDYEQGEEYLFDGERYCCLGVACTLNGVDEDLMLGGMYGLPGNISEPDLPLSVYQNFCETSNQKALCNIVAALNDGSSIYICTENEKEVYTSTLPNDSYKKFNKDFNSYSFKEIADWLEQNVETE